MEIILNGAPLALDDHATIAALLELRELAQRPCAVEVNRALVPKRAHDTHVLRAGDEVEVVTLVGGG